MEIERKFILDTVPSADRLGVGEVLRQGYLAEESDVEVRLRITAASATVTIKTGRGRSRTEVELPIGIDRAEALWPFTAGRRIDKTRYRVPLPDELVAEVDIYAGELAGLAVVEVEFPTDEVANGFDTPAWFGRELTNEPGWSNAALARSGRPSRE